SLLSACSKSDYSIPATPAQAAYRNDLRDDFNSDTHNWSYNNTVNNSSISISSGYLFYTYHPSTVSGNIQQGISTSISSSANFLLETSFTSDNVMGMFFGANDTAKGFSFKIDKVNKRYALYNEGDTTHGPLAIFSWTSSNAIKVTGFDTLKLEQVGNVWNGYINSTQIFYTTARPLLGDSVGYIMSPGTNGQADYLDIKW
ncbi:MAG TPA: hypothetical protein VK809_10955, partial [Bacteroidia bacterium]|nr:hypothetical protein [Bacteroidia bacterium]